MKLSASYTEPKPSNLTKASVSGLAERFAVDVGFLPGADIEAIVAKLSGKITYQDFWDLEDTTDGSIVIDGPGKFHVFLGSHISPDRTRFTIAHELGHYVLHYLLPNFQGRDVGPVRARRYGGRDRTEYEANWFAAAFLMPEQAFRETFVECGGDMVEIASHFRVSISAAGIRVKTLNLG
jgi:Zn-dependent peptidase ImmA (M78 family)